MHRALKLIVELGEQPQRQDSVDRIIVMDTLYSYVAASAITFISLHSLGMFIDAARETKSKIFLNYYYCFYTFIVMSTSVHRHTYVYALTPASY